MSPIDVWPTGTLYVHTAFGFLCLFQPSKVLPLEEVDLGFEAPGILHLKNFIAVKQYLNNLLSCKILPDYITAEAAKILRLLHIRELRELQNNVNQAIVSVQALTANPKTDTKLGKVGKG